MILQLLAQPVEFIAFLAAILLAVSIHEAAHALAASALGDDTAKLNGRLTLNPLAHLDAIGGLMFLLVGFGWGKPVPVNPNNFRKPALDDFKVALAGPTSNLLTAAAFGLPLRILADDLQGWAVGVLSLFVFINLALMTFNLIPIPPLDGSKILSVIFGRQFMHRFEKYSIFLIIAILLLARSDFPIISHFLEGGTSGLFRLITGINVGF